MKRIISMILVCAMMLMICSCAERSGTAAITAPPTEEQQVAVSDYVPTERDAMTAAELEIYDCLVGEINTENVFVDKVEIINMSQEFYEESLYNSRENVFFGYSLSELDRHFEGGRYVFTLGEDGQTVVQEFVCEDDGPEFSQTLGYLAVGAGVVLVCVTVVVVAKSGGFSAIKNVFAGAADAWNKLMQNEKAALIAGQVVNVLKDYAIDYFSDKVLASGQED